MEWLFLAIAALVLLVVLLLAIPVELKMRLDTAAVRRLRVSLVWLFGLVRMEFGGGEQAPARRTARKPRRQSAPARTRRGGFGAMMRSQGFLPALFRLFKDLFSQVKIRELACRLDFGLDDPADTGHLYGTLMALPVARRDSVVLTPHFDHERLDAACALAARAVPLQVSWVAIRFALSPAVLRALWASRRA